MATNPKDNTVADATLAPFRFGSRIMFSIMLMWFMSVAVHITWINFYKLPVQTHMEQLIGYYVDRASAKGFVERVANGAYWVVFEATSLQKIISTPPAPQDDKIALSGAIRRGTWAAFKPELNIAAYATVLYGVKLGVLVLALPLLAALLLCFGVDGLVQRYVRRACGGHESAALYHRAKLYGIKLLPPFASVVFLCSPVAFDPAWLFLPVTLLCALLLRVQATYYKKYL